MNEVEPSNAEIAKLVETGKNRTKALLTSYEVVLDDLKRVPPKAPVGIRLPTKAPSMSGVPGHASYTTTPPEVRVRVRAPEKPWNGRDPILAAMVAEHAIRDAAFYLFGRRTGPGYTLSLKPTRLIAEEGCAWIETRVMVIPKDEPHRDRLVKKLAAACDRARIALKKTGVVLVEEVPVESLPGDGSAVALPTQDSGSGEGPGRG